MLKNYKNIHMMIITSTPCMKKIISGIVNTVLWILVFFSGTTAFSKVPNKGIPQGLTSCTGFVAVYTASAPVIDGTVDAIWSVAPANIMSKTISGTIQTGSTWQAMYDATNLYILVQVKDANLSSTGTNVYDQDGAEIFIAGNNSKAGAYTANDHQYRFNWNVAATTANISGNTGSTTGITYAIPTSTGGYTLEVSIPWTTIGGTGPSNGKLIGFDININDQQNNAGSREATVGWNGTNTDDFSNTADLGTVTLCVPSPVISSSAAVSGTVGTAFSYTSIASNTPTSYSVTGTLPAGVTINTSTGVISGTPTASGTFSVTLNATNAGGTGTEGLVITIANSTISSLNGLTASVQTFAIDSSGSNFSIVSSVAKHTFNIPTASATKRGLLSASDWSNFNSRGSGTVTSIVPGYGLTGSSITTTGTLVIDTAALSIKYIRKGDSATAYTTLKRLSDSAASIRAAISSSSATQTFVPGTGGSDFTITTSGTTHTFNLPTASATNRGALSSADWNTFNSKPSLSGTSTNYITKVTGSNTVGNSQIFDNGTNVGIGTTNINDATYKLYVETGIRTRKVKVDQLTWADFVFDKNYVLPSLIEVEKYIQQNKHLPGVPSAEDVKNNGVDVSDNQQMLLKKVEELTLYLIDLNKKVDELSKENKILKKKISSIKKR
jgi:hypothetical protein